MYKRGDKSDPNNDRGICVSSNLGQVFRCILNTCVQAFLTEHSVWRKMRGETPQYGGQGSQINLIPAISGRLDDILWKHNGSKVVEFDGREQRVYGTYANRVILDWHTAELTIKDLSDEDSGVYDLEATKEGVLQLSQHKVEVIDQVAEPTISCVFRDSRSPNTSDTEARLVCSAEPRGAPAPMEFSWRLPGGSRPGPELPVSIQGEDDDTVYICVVSNPLSNKTATYRVKNCYAAEGALSSSSKLIIGLVVALIIVAIITAVAVKLRPWSRWRKTVNTVQQTETAEEKPSLDPNPEGHVAKVVTEYEDRNVATDLKSPIKTQFSNQSPASLVRSCPTNTRTGSENRPDQNRETEPLLSTNPPSIQPLGSPEVKSERNEGPTQRGPSGSGSTTAVTVSGESREQSQEKSSTPGQASVNPPQPNLGTNKSEEGINTQAGMTDAIHGKDQENDHTRF
ncbi:uncharacterized protein LOC130121002 [Lampris incognitus]|uniref:uncharacterized protein LOC130121002 n=1 Tax=Lampris incognitus TaxID=2546036 RepID=UPI0024B5C1EF|nr:uncharacterized protein LOC130121002 [Lampris incognitus]